MTGKLCYGTGMSVIIAGDNPICGVDEAGRGPLAGPVSAAAVILPADFPLELLNDSKKLSEKKRWTAYCAIVSKAIWAQAWAWPHEIDEINILRASLTAMQRAVAALVVRPGLVLVDGNRAPEFDVPVKTIIRGDSLEPSIMAASIVAKVSRDRLMERYDWLYPEYGYAKHKGYPTKAHCAACRELGPSPIQRLTFKVPSA